MPDKLMRLRRNDAAANPAPGDARHRRRQRGTKPALTRGIAERWAGTGNRTVCGRLPPVDRETPPRTFTVLNPECNYMDVMERHLQLLALGRPILKPVYDHSTGRLVRPVLVEPRDFVIVEGLLPLHTKLARACFDIIVYLDPPEEIRKRWKLRRDTTERGYTRERVLAELERREPESAAFIRPQRQWADISRPVRAGGRAP